MTTIDIVRCQESVFLLGGMGNPRLLHLKSIEATQFRTKWHESRHRLSYSYSKQNIPANDYYWYNSLYTAIPDTPIVRVLLGHNEE